MTVHLDRINTGSYRIGTEGVVHVLEATVTGVDGDAWTRRGNALRAPGMPQRGVAHPNEPGLFLMEMDVEPVTDSPSKAIVRLTYRRPRPGEVVPSEGDYGPATWTTDATTYSETTYKDVNGRPLLAGYRGRPIRTVVNATTGTITEEAGAIGEVVLANLARVSIDRSVLVLRAARYERVDPERVAALFVPSVNALAWRGYPAGEVKLQNIRSTSRADGGFDVEYEFHRRPERWEAEVAVDYNGQVPQDAVVGNGIEFYPMLVARNFAELRL